MRDGVPEDQASPETVKQRAIEEGVRPRGVTPGNVDSCLANESRISTRGFPISNPLKNPRKGIPPISIPGPIRSLVPIWSRTAGIGLVLNNG